MEKRISGKIVRLMKSGLFFIRDRENKKTYVSHTKFTDSKIKEGRYVYFFPSDPQPIFDDDTSDGKHPFARDVKRYSDLSESEKEMFAHATEGR